MKKIIVLVLFLVPLLCSGQNNTKVSSLKKTTSSVNELHYSVTSLDEYKEINWNQIRDIFSNNKNNEEIQLSFSVDLMQSKNKIKGALKVGGTSSQIDALLLRAQKGLNGLIKVINKNKA